MMLTLSSLVAPEVVVMAAYGAAVDENVGKYEDSVPAPYSRPKRIPRSYPSLKNTPFSWILGKKTTPLSTEIADFEVQ